MRKGKVLFIVIDQIRADALAKTDGGRALGDHVATPNIDRLRAEGVSFENHFTVTVPCGPARASLLTGLYAMNHRSIRNGTPLAWHHATVASEARKTGYEPLLFGYCDTTPDPTRFDPNDPELQGYEKVAKGFREIVEMRLEEGREWPAYLLKKGYDVRPPEDHVLPSIFKPVAAGGGEPAISDPALYSEADSDTAYLTDRTLEAMSARVFEPWFAHVTYIRPHPPFVAPAPYNKLVAPGDLPATDGSRPAHAFMDAWFSTRTQKSMFWGFDGDCANLDPAKAAEIRAVYLGLIAEVDKHVGRLLDWLDATGQRDDTLVVLTGDHGEMLGDKKMWGKDSVFEPAYHVPLIIRDPRNPRAAGRKVTAVTESVDVTPTILEWIGLTPPQAMDGRSLAPWLEGGTTAWRDAAFMEIDLSNPKNPTRFQLHFGLDTNDCNAAILREERWKLVHFNGGLAPMLFDLENDPGETVNLAGDPAHAGEIARLTGKMLDRRMQRADRRLTGYAIGG